MMLAFKAALVASSLLLVNLIGEVMADLMSSRSFYLIPEKVHSLNRRSTTDLANDTLRTEIPLVILTLKMGDESNKSG